MVYLGFSNTRVISWFIWLKMWIYSIWEENNKKGDTFSNLKYLKK